MIRKTIVIIIFISTTLMVHAQQLPSKNWGKISFISSKNIYVRFSSTQGLSRDDTLYLQGVQNMRPALLVRSVSSVSAVCEPLDSRLWNIGDSVFYFLAPIVSEKKDTAFTQKDTAVISEQIESGQKESEQKLEQKVPPVKKAKKSAITGKIGISTNSGFISGGSEYDYYRMRYVVSLNAYEINNGPFSFESYLTFTHKKGQWNEIQQNAFNGLKIYNLSLTYKKNNTEIYGGRKINRYAANMGAIDGLQWVQHVHNMFVGAFAGTRPDYNTYGFSGKFPQFGVLAGFNNRSNSMQTSFVLAEQRSENAIDRRFLYIQHSNRISSRLFTFASLEADFFSPDSLNLSSVRLTGLYLMLRYSPTSQLSLSASFDARNRIIYFETYKSFIEQIIEEQMRQGFNFRVHYRPGPRTSLGLRGTYRYRKHDPAPSSHYSAYVGQRDLFLPHSYLNLSLNYLMSSYIKGSFANLSYRHPLWKDQIHASYQYSFFTGLYRVSETSTLQNDIQLGLDWELPMRSYLMLAYELQLENKTTFNRLYINITKRF